MTDLRRIEHFYNLLNPVVKRVLADSTYVCTACVITVTYKRYIPVLLHAAFSRYEADGSNTAVIPLKIKNRRRSK